MWVCVVINLIYYGKIINSYIKGRKISKRFTTIRSRNNDEIAILPTNTVQNFILFFDVDEDTMNVITENTMSILKGEKNVNIFHRKKVTVV